jgi:hypothetical protein
LSEAKQIEGSVAQQEVYSYVEALKQKAKVTVNRVALESKSNLNAAQ